VKTSERKLRTSVVRALFAVILVVPFVIPGESVAQNATSGQDDFVFRFVPELSELPARAKKYEKNLHGGFVVDRRSGKGEIYFGVKGVGLVQLSGDLSRRRILKASEELASINIHNASIFYSKDGKAYLLLPSNEARKVYITDLEGTILRILENPQHNEYYRDGGAFVPCDAEVVNGVLYIVTGYSLGDYCVTADPFTAEWLETVFGGKGEAHGKFGIGHGITHQANKKLLAVCDRSLSRIEKFSYKGEYKGTVALPNGSFPVDIDYHPLHPELAVVGCLHGSDRKKGAPIYILRDDKVVSTILAKEDLGIREATHLHDVVWRVMKGAQGTPETYLVCQTWNPGKVFVLKRVFLPVPVNVPVPLPEE